MCGLTMKLLLEDRLKSFQDDPRKRLARAGVSAGMKVVDLGAGRGLYSLLSAGMVGSRGAVYAVEPDGTRAATIARRAVAEKLDNIKVLGTGAEHLDEIPSSTIDLAFALNSLHHFQDKAVAFAEVSRVLKAGGRFYVRDMIWKWYLGHGTRLEDVQNLPTGGFSAKTVEVAKGRLEATFTK